MSKANEASGWQEYLMDYLVKMDGPAVLRVYLADLRNDLEDFEMEGADLEFREDALRAIAKRAMKRKTGARGLRTILEGILLETMYDLPSMENAKKVVVDEAVVTGETSPYIIHETDDTTPLLAVDEEQLSAGSDGGL